MLVCASGTTELTWSQRTSSVLHISWLQMSLWSKNALTLNHLLIALDNANGEKERLSPLTWTSTLPTKNSLLPTSAIHQPLTTGKKLLQNVSHLCLLKLANKLVANGQLEKNSSQILTSALLLKLVKMLWHSKLVLISKQKMYALPQCANGI